MLFSPTIFSLVVFLGSAVSISAHSIPSSPRSPDASRPPAKCTKKLQRKAWHALTNKEKKAYIDAELCLMKKPAKLGLPATRNRFEELQSIHQIPASITHSVGAFLPYHRLHMHTHERAMREECGYKGAQPYWDEPRDAGKFSLSVVFDPVTGFGGNGTRAAGGQGPAGGCITNGPFVNFVNNLGPGYRKGTPHCIYRLVNDTLSTMVGQAYVNECLAKSTYLEFWPCVEAAPHVGGHAGVGGKMADPIASPGDPLFYLHHTWLDKIFWDWQALDLPARLADISGRNTPPPPGSPPTGANSSLPFFLPSLDKLPPLDALIPPPDAPLPEGDPGNVTTLNHVLNMLGVIPSATIRDVMDIGGPLLCYEYV